MDHDEEYMMGGGEMKGYAVGADFELVNQSIECLVIAYSGPAVSKQLQYMNTVHKSIIKHPSAGPFLNPVDVVRLNLPDYHKIIKNPMDLFTIGKKLRKKAYANALECIDDFRLMFRNCRTYNGPHDDVVVMCRAVEFAFRTKILKLPPAENVVVNGKKQKSGGAEKSLAAPPQAVGSAVRTHGAVASTHGSVADGRSKAPAVYTDHRQLNTTTDTAMRKRSMRSSDDSFSADLLPARHDDTARLSKKRRRERSEDSEVSDPYNIATDSPALSAPQGNGGVTAETRGEIMRFCGTVMKEFYSKRGQAYASLFYEASPLLSNGSSSNCPITHLDQVKAKLEGSRYTSIAKFAEDVRGMVANCISSNPNNSDMVAKAKKLRSVFERKFKRVIAERGASCTAIKDGGYDQTSTDNSFNRTTATHDEESSSGNSSSSESEVDDKKEIESLQLKLKMLQENIAQLQEEQTKANAKKKARKISSGSSTMSRAPSTISTASSAAASKTLTSDLIYKEQSSQFNPPVMSQAPSPPLLTPAGKGGVNSGGKSRKSAGKKAEKPSASHRASKQSKTDSVSKPTKAPVNKQSKSAGSTMSKQGRAVMPESGLMSDSLSTGDDDYMSNADLSLMSQSVTSSPPHLSFNSASSVSEEINMDSFSSPELSAPKSKPVVHSLPRQPMRPSATAAPKPQQPIRTPVTTPSVIKHTNSGRVEMEDLESFLGTSDTHDMRKPEPPSHKSTNHKSIEPTAASSKPVAEPVSVPITPSQPSAKRKEESRSRPEPNDPLPTATDLSSRGSVNGGATDVKRSQSREEPKQELWPSDSSQGRKKSPPVLKGNDHAPPVEPRSGGHTISPPPSHLTSQSTSKQSGLFQPAFLSSSSSKPSSAEERQPSLSTTMKSSLGGGAGGWLPGKPESPLLAGMNPANLQRSNSGLWKPHSETSGSESASAGSSVSALSKWTAAVSARDGGGSAGGMYKSGSQSSSNPVLSTTPTTPSFSHTAAGPLAGANASSNEAASSATDSSKKEPTLKNATSWSKIATMSQGTPGGATGGGGAGGSSSIRKSSAMQSFELFRRQAKEKEEREKRDKEEAERRVRHEREEAERQAEIERERQEEEERQIEIERQQQLAAEAAERKQREEAAAAAAVSEVSHNGEQQTSEQRKKEIERMREQERRRRAAATRQIDMNAQSELMASFEYHLQ